MDAAVSTIIDTIEEQLYLYDIEFEREDCDRLFELIYEVYLKNNNIHSYIQDMIGFVRYCFEKNDYGSEIIKKDLFIDNLNHLDLSEECINNIKEELLIKKK